MKPLLLRLFPVFVLSAALVGACGDDTQGPGMPDAHGIDAPVAPAAIDAGMLVDGATGIDAVTGVDEAAIDVAAVDLMGVDATPLPEFSPNGIIVLQSDYQSSSVSFLDRDGTVLKDGCYNSGSTASGISMTLSGDVVLPSFLSIGQPMVLIDRQNASLTWIDPATCQAQRQLGVGTGFASNPHDMVMVSATKAYVTRYEANAAATPSPVDFDDGNDLLIIDPTMPKITGRIDLSATVADYPGILPRADRALLVEGMVYVSLNAIAPDYRSYGPGRIAVVDPATDAIVEIIDVPEAQNCGAMTYLAADRRLLVVCSGDTSSRSRQIASSAVAVIDITTTPRIATPVLDAEGLGGPLSNGAIAALNADTVLAVAQGDFVSGTPDQLWSISTDKIPPVKTFESREAFAMGALLADPGKARIFVGDGTVKTPAVLRRFDSVAGALTQSLAIKSNPSRNLPPRALAWY